MIIGKIKQEGTRLTTDNSDIAYQYSANQVITVEFGDTTFTGYTLCWYCAFDRAMKKTVIMEYDAQTKQITLPASVFEVTGNIYIALRAIKEKEILSSSPVNFYIGASTNPNASNAPREPGWEEVVQALIDDVFKQEYKEPMDAMIVEAKKQQKLAATLEVVVNNANTATNAANNATTKANEATNNALAVTKRAETALSNQSKLDAAVAEVSVKHGQIMDFMQNTGSGELIQGLQEEIQEVKGFIGLDDTIYGVEVDLPNRTYTRLAGAKNLLPGTDFDNIGPWKRRRCIMTEDGVVLAYYGEENYKDYGGLTTIEIEKHGKVYPVNTRVLDMVEQPKFYYKIVPKDLEPADGGGYHMRRFRVYISPISKQGFKVHPAFVRDGRELDCIYLASYQGVSMTFLNSETGETYARLYSVGGYTPYAHVYRSNMRKYTKDTGPGWQIRDAWAKGATTLLFLVEYNTLRADAIGPGNISGSIQKNGITFKYGNASGSDKETNVVTYRGEENLWGNYYEWVDGLNIKTVNGKVDIYYAHDGYTDSTDATPYTKVQGSLPNKYGYISAFLYTGDNDTDTLFLPSEALGNSKLLNDFYSFYGSDSPGWYSAYGNGESSYASGILYFGAASTGAGNAVKCAARPMYIPPKKEPQA